MARQKLRWDGISKNKKQREQRKKPLPNQLMCEGNSVYVVEDGKAHPLISIDYLKDW